MKKQLKFLLLLLLVAGATAVKAQTVILEESLTGVYGQQIELNSPLSILPNWTLTNCYSYCHEKYSEWYIQVGWGSSDNKHYGSITTPALTGLTGNARLTFDILAYSKTDQQIKVSIVNGDVEEVVTTYSLATKDDWYSKTARDRAKKIRLFSCNSTYFKFMVKDIVVTDLGDYYYIETFDNLNGIGGNDGDWTLEGRESLDVSKLIIPATFDSGVTIASQCVNFQNSSPSFTTAPITTASEKAHVAISFRVAGDNGMSSSTPLTVTYYSNGTSTSKTPTVTKKSWKTINYTTNYFHLNRGIKFSGQNFFLDDIKVMPVFDVTIDEQADNSSILQKRSGNHVDATLHRTLTAGIWNTLCLPFAVSNTMISNSATIRQLTSVSNGVYNFKTVNNVPAGEPFLVKVNETVTNPTFTDVVIEAPTPTTKTFGNYGFAGVYSPTQLNVDGTHLFLGTDGYLYAPSDANSNTINGMRAYFVLPSGNARVAFVEDEEAAGITEHNREQIMSDGCYNLIGQPVSSPARGLYIVDGKKTLMK